MKQHTSYMSDISSHINLKESTIHKIIFFNVFCGTPSKTSNYNFRLQKGVKIQIKFEFWRLERLIINQITLSYRVISIWKDLRCIMSFSLTFYAENLQKRQITVLGYKKGWKFKINLNFENFRCQLLIKVLSDILSYHFRRIYDT